MTNPTQVAEPPERGAAGAGGLSPPPADERPEQIAERVLAAGIVLSVAGVAAQTVLHLTDILAFDRSVNTFDADEDYSISSWASVAVTFAAASSALLLGVVLRSRLFYAAAIVFAFLSLDDFIRFHERVGELGSVVGIEQEEELGRVIWPVLLFPLLFVTAALLWLAAKEFSGRVAWLLRGGLILLAAAVVLEAASSALFQLDYGHRTWPYELEVILEEGAELAGWIWIATALTAAACLSLARRA